MTAKIKDKPIKINDKSTVKVFVKPIKIRSSAIKLPVNGKPKFDNENIKKQNENNGINSVSPE